MPPETDLTGAELRELYEEMVLIRRFETRLERLYEDGLIPSSIHLCCGHEAVPVGLWAALEEADLALANHRPDGHVLAKGVDLEAVLAEYFGRAGGPCGGRAGSMHFCSVDDGFYGANGVVGGNLPHALGLAYATRLLDDDAIVVCAFGDGGANGGAFGECLNMSSLWDLPVLWCCENNRYAETTPVAESTAGSIAARADGYDVRSEVVDGMDVVAVYEAVRTHADVVRAGSPALLEFECYRFKGHSRADPPYGPDHYRDRAEVERWMERDPIPRLADDLGLTDAEVEETRAAVEARIDAAVEAARRSPRPDVEALAVYE